VSMTDPIADLLTRIRNANSNGSKSTVVPYSKVKKEILRVLKEQGVILDYFPEMQGKRGVLRIDLKYGPDGEKVIQHIERVSRPGRRIYARTEAIPSVLNDLGFSVLSTTRGFISDAEARKMKVGGEIICKIW
jgi:small subunit ribosomal protein S8